MSFVITESITDQRGKLLLISLDGQILEELALEQSSNVIGRGKDCNIIIEIDNISREHARILYTPEGFFISDLESTNGTFLNGYLVKPNHFFKLEVNDRISLGTVSFIFEIEHRIIEKRKLNENYSIINDNSATYDERNNYKFKLEVEKKDNSDLGVKNLGLTFHSNQRLKPPESLSNFVNREQDGSTVRFDNFPAERTEQKVTFSRNKLSSEESYYFPQADSSIESQEFLLDLKDQELESPDESSGFNSFQDLKYKLDDSGDSIQFFENKEKLNKKTSFVEQVFSDKSLGIISLIGFFLFLVFYFKLRPAFG